MERTGREHAPRAVEWRNPAAGMAAGHGVGGGHEADDREADDREADESGHEAKRGDLQASERTEGLEADAERDGLGAGEPGRGGPAVGDEITVPPAGGAKDHEA